jgi:hypothetical protein
MSLHSPDPSHGFSDAVLAGGLVTAPAWAGPLSDINALLTMVSLLVGLAIGVIRLWRLWRESR